MLRTIVRVTACKIGTIRTLLRRNERQRSGEYFTVYLVLTWLSDSGLYCSVWLRVFEWPFIQNMPSTVHTREGSMPAKVRSTHRGGVYASGVHTTHKGGVYASYSTHNTQGWSLYHLQYTPHTEEDSMPSTICSIQGVLSIPSAQGVLVIPSTEHSAQTMSLCHLQYTQHTGEESMPSAVHSTHRGGVCAIYSTLNTQGKSLCHLQYTQHTG